MKEYIKGNYRKTIYANNGYLVGIFKVRETNIKEMEDYINKTVTFTGFFGELNMDDLYILYGSGLINKKYGFQFQVQEYERVKPEDRDSLIEFLSSDLFIGVGLKTATSIVDLLGSKVTEMILKDKNVLLTIPHLKPAKIDMIYDTLVKYEESSSLVLSLTELGFSMKTALLIYNKYGKESSNYVNTNIYDLVGVIDDVTFLKVDIMHNKLDIPNDDKRRVKGAILYIMKELCYRNSDAYLCLNDIYNNVNTYLKLMIDIEVFNNYIDELVLENKIVIENNNYYLKKVYDDERYVAKELVHLATIDPLTNKKIINYISEQEKFNHIIYNETQKQAIKKALENNIVIITGGPGTGKTTIIKAITAIYQDMNKLTPEDMIDKVALLAPTGRASKKMTEKALIKATTIHRYLKWDKDTDTFAINEDNKKEHHLIIVDEVSMIDISLLANLFKGLTSNIKLVLVGDYDQIPSVGIGQVLKDMIESNIIDTIYLNEIYRQDSDSYIPILASEVKQGILGSDILKNKSDYLFIECPRYLIKDKLKEIVKDYNYRDVQIMAPIYNGENGIDLLNHELQKIFNPYDTKRNELLIGDTIYRVGDKVLQLKNMPDDNIFNGDIGIITIIVDREVTIDFDGNIITYKGKDLNKIKHAYVVSIHKAQGSEFDFVIVPIISDYKKMLYKKLIYTAITRAKKKLILIGEVDAFSFAVSNNNECLRKTSLKEQINKYLMN